MRTVVRNSFARQTIQAERVRLPAPTIETLGKGGCTECGSARQVRDKADATRYAWLYRFHMDDDQGSRQSGLIANGKLFCSRSCAEHYLGQPFDETR